MIKWLISAGAAWQKAVADGKLSEGEVVVGVDGGEVGGRTIRQFDREEEEEEGLC